MHVTSTESSDEELILACRAGNEQAWQSLVLRYQRLIFTIARRAGLDEDAAADVLQQVFTILVTYLDKIERPAQIHAWLVTTARRETLRILRARGSFRTVSVDGHPDDESPAFELPDESPLQDELLMRLEMEHRVRTEVAALDQRCRELLTLLFYSAATPAYSDIAKILGISEGSIGPNRARCLQKLQNKIYKIGS